MSALNGMATEAPETSACPSGIPVVGLDKSDADALVAEDVAKRISLLVRPMPVLRRRISEPLEASASG